MKRIRKRETPPAALTDYIRDNPESSDAHTWDAFRDNSPSGMNEVMDALYEDQGGLCAYCEIELLKKRDFRVSHFHPKRAQEDAGSRAWELKWANMHGACHGGTIRFPQDRAAWSGEGTRPTRHEMEKRLHCDAVLGNEILDDQLLNPLNIPAFPRLFKYEERLSPVNERQCWIVADKTLCDEAESNGCENCYERAVSTIEKLHLNSSILLAKRQWTYDAITAKIAELTGLGLSEEAARERVVEVVFAKTSKWPDFFTLWRFTFKDQAEKQLRSIEFNG